MIEVDTGGSMDYETPYRKSLAGDDILFLFIRFCDHEVEKPVRVIIL